MRRGIQVVSIFCTLLLLGLGLSTPQLAALVLDRQLEHDVVELENTNISLMLEQEIDFFRTLNLFDEEHLQVELSEGYRMKVEEVEDAAMEIRASLAASDTTNKTMAIMPMLLTSKNDPSMSSVFWKCTWRESEGAQEVLWLDDQSGRMVSFTGRVRHSTVSAPDTTLSQSAVNVVEYCRLHYPVDTVNLVIDIVEYYYDGQYVVVSERGDKNEERYVVTLLKTTDEQEKAYSIPLRHLDGWLYFNT